MLIVDSGSESSQKISQPSRPTFFPHLGSIANSALDSRRRTNSMSQAGPYVTDLEVPENPLGKTHSFTILHIGKNGGTYQLFADSPNTRKMWKEKIAEAQTKLQLSRSSQQVFELFTLNDATFGTAPIGGASKGKVTCSVPFGE